MDDLSKRSCLVYDNGLFVELAVTLSRTFGKTYYYSPWQRSFPRSNEMMVGDGLPRITRVDSIWPLVDSIDLFVFPDLFHGPLQVYLDKLGKRVWGGRLGENLEILRGLQKRWLKKADIAVADYRQIQGTDRLREYLKEHENVYVKISRTRGDMETFHSENYRLIEPRLTELEHILGAKKTVTEFIVEDAIDDALEVGYDGYTIDGRFPAMALHGVESKDAAYFGEVGEYNALPGAIRSVNNKLAALLQSFRYRGFFSADIRIKNGTPYVIDPCMRMASPPGELYQYMIENLAEIMYEGAMGKVIEPKFKGRYGAELVMQSHWAETNWQPVDYPPSIAEQVKLHYRTVIDGRNYFVPQEAPMKEIGAVVGYGNTADEAIANVTKAAKKVSGYDIKFDYAALDDAAAQMRKLKKAA